MSKDQSPDRRAALSSARRRVLAQGALLVAACGTLVVGARNLENRNPRRSTSESDIAEILAAAGPVPVVDLRLGYRGRPVEPEDASDALDVVLAALADADGGTVYVPPGDWVLDRAVALDVPGVSLVGAGMRASRLQVRAGSPGSGFPAVRITADDVTVERLGIVGRAANLGHGISVGANAGHVTVRDVVIEDVTGYGIGFQRQSDGTGGVFSDIVIDNVAILRPGNDGIDLKNFDAADDRCNDDPALLVPGLTSCHGTRSFFRNISVVQHARLDPTKRGIDVRGQRLLQNIDVLEVGAEASGIVFRPEDGGPTNGRGAQWSVVDNYFISLADEQATALFADSVEGVVVGTGSVRPPPR